MTSPEPAPRLVAHPRYLVILALSAGAILLVGSLLRPRTDEASAPPQMPEGEMARLRLAAQRRSLQDETDYFRSVSTDLGTAVAYLAARHASGVAWGMGRVVTAGAWSEAPTGDAAGGPAGPRPRERPVVALDAPGNPLTPPRADGSLTPGDWILAVWDTDTERAFVPGRFMGLAASVCGPATVREVLTSLPLSRSMAGAGLFDLYGNLVGVVASCGPRLATITAGSVDSLLAEATTVPARLLDEYGLEVAVPTEQEAAHFERTEGVLVRAVWADERAAASDLRPGDFIVGLDGTTVATLGDLERLAEAPPGTVPVLSVARLDETIDVPLGPPGPAPDAERGYQIDQVPPESVASRAGLRPGDRLLRIDQRDVRPNQATSLLAGRTETPVWVEVDRGARRWGQLLP